MPRIDRRILLATLGGLVAAAILVLAALYSYREFYEPAKHDQASQGYQPARDATGPARPPNGKPQPDVYDPHCQQPQTHDDADLCAQWGAVRAVAETNRLTRVALRLGYVGFWVAFLGGMFGIVGTILLWLAWQETRASNRIARRDYGKARVEAKQAARAAAEAREHTVGVSATEMRPWVDISIASFKIGKAGNKVHIGVTVILKNSGKTPALRARCDVKALPFNTSEYTEVSKFFDSALPATASVLEMTILPQSTGSVTTGDDITIVDDAIHKEGGKELVYPMIVVKVAYCWPGNDVDAITNRAFLLGPVDSDGAIQGVDLSGAFPIRTNLGTLDRGLCRAT